MPRTIAYRAGGFTNCGISYTKFSQEELAEMKDRAMTENEAIKGLETSIDLAKMCTQNYERKREIQCYEMAINALKEIQKYRKIGTPEECGTAVKQTAKKPIFNHNLSDTLSVFRCECGNTIKVSHDTGIMDNNNAPNYCSKCGCRFDWSDEE